MNPANDLEFRVYPGDLVEGVVTVRQGYSSFTVGCRVLIFRKLEIDNPRDVGYRVMVATGDVLDVDFLDVASVIRNRQLIFRDPSAEL